jgi:predicted Zn-dependent protease
MADDLIARFEALLSKGGDGAALRLALASRYLDAGDAAAAVRHAEAAVRLDPEYSAGWKAFGRALTAAGRATDALAAYERGRRSRSGAATNRPQKKCASSASVCSGTPRSRKTRAPVEREAQWWPWCSSSSGTRGGGRLSALSQVLMPK